MARSSIFSSSTLTCTPRLTKAGALALVLFLLVRIFLQIRPVQVLNCSEDIGYTAFSERELRYRLSEQKHPKVVLMGTSRLDAAPFTNLPDMMGIARDDFMNLSQTGNSFWINTAFLRRNPGVLSNARVVIMDLLPYQIRQHVWLFPEDDETFLRFSSLDERLRVSEPAKRFSAFADCALLTWSETRQPVWWMRGLDASLDSPQEFEKVLRLRVTNEQVGARERLRHTERQVLNQSLSTLYFSNLKIAANQIVAMNELARLMPENSRLSLVMFPISNELTACFSKDPEKLSAFNEFKAIVGRVASPRVEVLWGPEPAAGKFEEEDFLDGIHFTATGLEKVSNVMAEMVRQEFPQGL